MVERHTALMETVEDRYQHTAPIKVLYKWAGTENGAFFWKVGLVDIQGVHYAYSDNSLPEWARKFADEHRPTTWLGTPDAFTEVEPFGPTDQGASGADLDIGTRYGRRFARRTDDGWLVIDTAFCTAAASYDELYAVVEGDAQPSQIVRTDTHIRCASLATVDDPSYEDTAYHTITSMEPTDANAKRLCEALRPEHYVWDGQDIVHGPPE